MAKEAPRTDFIFRLLNLSTATWVLIVLFAGGFSYILALGIFKASELGTQKIVFQQAEGSGAIYTMNLTKVDHAAKKVDFNLHVNLPQGKQKAVKCLSLNYYIDTGSTQTAGGSTDLITLNEGPRYELLSREQPGEGYTRYKGSGRFHFETDVRQFPFDNIRFSARFSSQCREPNVQLEPTPAFELWVTNEISDYQLVQAQDGELRLERHTALRVLAIILLLLGFASAMALILKARTAVPDLSLLTYFVGLWGVRRILTDQIHDYKAFPTLIEVTVVFLFCFTIIGIGIMRYLATAQPISIKKQPRKE